MQKILDEQLSALTSAEFCSYVNVHRSISEAFCAIERTSPVTKLTLLARNSQRAMDAVLDQLGNQIDSSNDFESDFDCSIAALLLVLIGVDPQLALFASANVLRHGHRLWWSRALAHSYLLNKALWPTPIKEIT